jgi:hypothetical protein
MFNVAYRRVLDEELPEAVRYLAFLWAIEFYCWLTRQKFEATYLRIGKRYGFNWNEKPDGLLLISAAHYLKDERAAFLTKLREFDAVRREQKAQGQRRPWSSQIKDLYTPDWL